MRFRSFLFILFSWPSLSAGQESSINFIKDLIEDIAEQLPADYDLSELEDRFLYYYKHPIDLNSEEIEALKDLVFLSPLQINAIRNHIKEKGKLIELLELQSIPGLNLEDIQKLLPFVAIKTATIHSNDQLNSKNIFRFSESDLVLRIAKILEKQQGFQDLPNSKYLGNPLKLLLRYKYTFVNRISAALILEKDAGEYFLKNSKPLTDFSTAHLAMQHIGFIKQLVIGDFTLQFGQGLTLWTGFAFGKAADVASIAKREIGLKPYSSANEFSFLRGTAATFQLTKRLNAIIFGSARKLDASIEIDSNGTGSLSTINETGLHRTATEQANRNSLKQQVYGGIIQYEFGTLHISAITFHTHFNQRFITGKEPYRVHYFTGNNLTNLGINYNYTYKNCYVFGEIAKSINGGFASLNGILFSLSSKLSGAILNRAYGKDYHNFFNQATAEASQAINENGLYVGLNLTPKKGIVLSFYADYFNFPWMKFRVDALSKGHEILTQLSYAPNKIFKAVFRYKNEYKEQNTNKTVPINYLVGVNRNAYRFDASWQLSKTIHLQHRIEFNIYRNDEETREVGGLIYHDIAYRTERNKLSGNIRLAYFYTESFNTRIYAYEDDVLYNFSFTAYNEKGYRFYLNLKYKLIKNIDIWARYGLFIYPNAETVGSGLDEILGHKKSDIKFQVRYQF